MSALILTRRSLFGLLAAPAIIRVADIMPIRALILPLNLPWGVKLLRDLEGWKVGEHGVMVPIKGRELMLAGFPIAPEYLVELGNYDKPGTTMHIGPGRVSIGHVLGPSEPAAGWRA